MKKNLAFLFLMATLLAACTGKKVAFSLSNTNWELVSYGAVNQQTTALPDVAATISFDAEGKLSGNVGCNMFSGAYEVSGNKLTTGPLMATLMACDAPRMDQEYAVMQLLNGTLTFEGDGNTLTIFSEDGSSTLKFVRAE